MKYKSQLEKRIHTGPMKVLTYEPKDARLSYIVPKMYQPDLRGRDGALYEIKGRARTSDELRKYVLVKSQHPNIDLRFILMNPNVRAYPGCRTTLANWLAKYGFEWCHEDSIPVTWRK